MRIRTITSASTLQRLFWSLGSFASFYGFRLAASLVLTRLLAPEIFGVMVVVHSMRLGFELLTDIGIEQNIVQHKEGLEPRFLNTAWTMQIIRGTYLSAIFFAISPFLAHFYNIDERIFRFIAFAPLINSFQSTAIFTLAKNLEVKRRALFEFRAELIGFVASVVTAFISPTVWAPVAGILIQLSSRSLLSYRLPHAPHKLMLDRTYAREILRFGRWIMISSLVMFAAGNLDRLVLGRMAPLAMLGIYGLARTMADLPALMARRLSYQLIFPMLSAYRQGGGDALPPQMRNARLKLILIAAVVIGLGASVSDWVIHLMYQRRYEQAGWMLSLLLFGTWASVLSSFNEALLLGSGKPAYESAANVVRFSILGGGLWLGYSWIGLPGAIGALIFAEIGRYIVVSFGQFHTRLSFTLQDGVATLVLIGLYAAIVLGRVELGLGTPWASLVAR